MSIAAAANERSIAGAHPALYAELWTSFAGVLRSYAAAHGGNQTAQVILEVSSDSILVRAGSRSLLVTRGVDGAGSWQREAGEPTHFSFDEFGRIVLIGQSVDDPKEMDLVAERLMRELLR